jgi:hypothetical protein
LSDFRSNEFAIALAQPVHFHRDGINRDFQLHRYGVVGAIAGRSREKNFQVVELAGFPGGGELLPQSRQRPCEQGQGPAVLENLFCGHGGIRFQKIKLLGVVIVQGNECLTAPAFFGRGLVPLVGKKVIESRQEKRAELSLQRADIFEKASLEQMGKESLGQILSIMSVVALASDVGVERIPIGAAQPFQRLSSMRGHAITRGQHDAPMRGREVSRGCAKMSR